MSTINITNARANLYQLVSDVNVGFNPIEETLYLSSIPGLVNNINDIRKNEDWSKAEVFSDAEEW